MAKYSWLDIHPSYIIYIHPSSIHIDIHLGMIPLINYDFQWGRSEVVMKFTQIKFTLRLPQLRLPLASAGHLVQEEQPNAKCEKATVVW